MHYHITKRPAVLLARGTVPFPVGMTMDCNPGMMLDDDGSVIFFHPADPERCVSASHDAFRHFVRAASRLYDDGGGFGGPVIAYNPVSPQYSVAMARAVFDHIAGCGLELIRLHGMARRERRMQKRRPGTGGDQPDRELQALLVREAMDGLQLLLESSNDDMAPGQLAALLRLINRPF